MKTKTKIKTKIDSIKKDTIETASQLSLADSLGVSRDYLDRYYKIVSIYNNNREIKSCPLQKNQVGFRFST